MHVVPVLHMPCQLWMGLFWWKTEISHFSPALGATNVTGLDGVVLSARKVGICGLLSLINSHLCRMCARRVYSPWGVSVCPRICRINVQRLRCWIHWAQLRPMFAFLFIFCLTSVFCPNGCGRGYCTGPNICTCDLRFGQVNNDPSRPCDVPICSNPCLNGGTCQAFGPINACQCPVGWGGSWCADRLCDPNCDINGYCSNGVFDGSLNVC
jgi:hypothetical protein